MSQKIRRLPDPFPKQIMSCKPFPKSFCHHFQIPIVAHDNYQLEIWEKVRMSKLRVSEAIEMFDVSQSGIYRDMENGIISFEKDERGKKVIQIAELQRVYQLRENGNSQKEEVGENGNVSYHEV